MQSATHPRSAKVVSAYPARAGSGPRTTCFMPFQPLAVAAPNLRQPLGSLGMRASTRLLSIAARSSRAGIAGTNSSTRSGCVRARVRASRAIVAAITVPTPAATITARPHPDGGCRREEPGAPPCVRRLRCGQQLCVERPAFFTNPTSESSGLRRNFSWGDLNAFIPRGGRRSH